MANAVKDDVLGLTAQIIAAHIGHNQVAADALPALIQSVYQSLSTAGIEAEPVVAQEPAVSIKRSVFPEYIVCLEDGAKMKMLKRYLKVRYDLTPDQYREKWALPKSYPMVAPNYASRRAELAKIAGLGRKVRAAEAAEVKTPVARKKGQQCK